MKITRFFPFYHWLLASMIIVTMVSCQKNSANKAPVVHAGNDTSAYLNHLENGFQLKGTAEDKDGQVVAYLWTKVSGPDEVSIANAGSAATTVNNLKTGQYHFRLMATDNEGANGVDSVKLTVLPTETKTLTVQPGNNVNEVLLGYVNSSGDISNTANVQNSAGAWTMSGSPCFVRSLFRFDLSALPESAVISSARLYLYSVTNPNEGNLVDPNFGANNTMLLKRVTANWNNTVRWQTQPTSDSASHIEIPHTAQRTLDIDVDVTNMVKTMQEEGNYGWILKLKTESYYNIRQFASSRAVEASKHPKLVIHYTN